MIPAAGGAVSGFSADEITALHRALAALQQELPEIPKSSRAEITTDKGRTYGYSYAKLSPVVKAIMPLLGKHGLSFTARPTLSAEGKFVLAYELRHEDGAAIGGDYPLPASGTPQAIGSAITYGRRYTLLAVTGAAPEDDDDDAAAAQAGAEERTAPVARQRPTRQRPGMAAAQSPQQQAPKPPLPGGTPPRGAAAQPRQLQQLAIMFGEMGYADPAGRRFACSVLVRRWVESAKELTAAEASAITAELHAVRRSGKDTATELEARVEKARAEWELDSPAAFADTADEENSGGNSDGNGEPQE